MELITLKGAGIGINRTPLLTQVDFCVEEGEFVYIVGKVGSGKSSLLKTLYGEFPPYHQEGEAAILGFDLHHLKRKQLPTLRKGLGIVFQNFQLLGERTVYENLDFVLRATGWRKRAAREDRIAHVLNIVHLENKSDAFPHQLSGGEKQRISIARALLNHPKIILADEPTANLDNENTEEVMTILRETTERGTAVVMVTHNLDLLRRYPGIVYQCDEGRITPLNNNATTI
jgi:cell division transport system ATP-binding protein